MGQSEAKQSNVLYAVPVTLSSLRESAVYRNPSFTKELIQTYDQNILTLQDMLIDATHKYPDNKMLGKREPLASEYTWWTYRQVLRMSERVGSAILDRCLYNTSDNLNLVGIFSKNCLEYCLLEYACILYNLTVVAVQNNAVKKIVEECQLETIFCSEELLEQVLSLENVKTIICLQSPQQVQLSTKAATIFGNGFEEMVLGDKQTSDSTQESKADSEDKDTNESEISEKGEEETPTNISRKEELEQFALSRDKELIFFQDLISFEDIKPYPKITPENIYTICYTSGTTTNNSKGAMISHSNCISSLTPFKISKCNYDFIIYPLKKFRVEESDVYYSVLPLSHIYEREVCHNIIANGASIGFASKNMASQKEDLEILQPTVYCSVPRLYNKVYNSIRDKIQSFDEGAYKKFFEYAVNLKLSNINAHGSSVKNPIIDKLLLAKIKKTFGGKTRVLFTGGAPLNHKVLKFLEAVLCVPIIQGYGQSESTGVALSTLKNDNLHDSVGGPGCNMEFKVISCPELKYLSSDEDEQGNPRPRGELLLRGGKVFKGYFNDPESTEKAIDKDGWLHTGDICEIETNGAVKIIDRRNNIFKLPLGEFVSPEKIEKVIQSHEWIQEVFVYGSPDKNYLVGIIVPDYLQFSKLLQINQKETPQDSKEYANLVKSNSEFRLLISQQLRLADQELLPYERIQQYHLVPQSLLSFNIFTASGKIVRSKLVLQFKQEIDQMYSRHDLS